ncbi:hypothetical protein D3C73_781690 [compost metagenome]
MCAGGQDQVVIVDGITRGQDHATVLAVNRGYLVVQQINALGGIKVGRTEQQVGVLDFSEQVRLRQRRALIGQAGLITDQGDLAFVTFLAQ